MSSASSLFFLTKGGLMIKGEETQQDQKEKTVTF